MLPATQQRKNPFSSFTYREACRHLGVTKLRRWAIAAEPVPIVAFFQPRWARLQRFALESLEVSKTWLSDAICEEGLEGYDRLKVWKGAYWEGETTCVSAEYLLQNGALSGSPFACVMEAQKDDCERRRNVW